MAAAKCLRIHHFIEELRCRSLCLRTRLNSEIGHGSFMLHSLVTIDKMHVLRRSKLSEVHKQCMLECVELMCSGQMLLDL